MRQKRSIYLWNVRAAEYDGESCDGGKKAMAVTSDKKFTVYLSFKNRATAEKWLKTHGIKMKSTDSQIISVKVMSEADKNGNAED